MAETKTATEQARAAGAKTPGDRKKAASATVKAMRAEAADGDQVVEIRGEVFIVHLKTFQTQMAEDYEFMELASNGAIPALLNVLLGTDGHQRLKELARNEDTGKVSTPEMGNLFQEVMEAAGSGN